jgi:hypothetical protein
MDIAKVLKIIYHQELFVAVVYDVLKMTISSGIVTWVLRWGWGVHSKIPNCHKSTVMGEIL